MSARSRGLSALAVMIVVAIGAVMVISGPTAAQDGTQVAFEVTWQPGGEREDNCNRRLPAGPSLQEDRPAFFTGFLEVVTIRNHAGDTQVMEPLAGELVEAEATDFTYCSITIEATLALSPGYTVWHEQTYLASIPPEGLQGDHHLIILAE